MFRKMKVFAFVIDPSTKSPTLLLKEVDGEKTLLITVGLLEAHVIASELGKIKFPRPMTHDLLKNILGKLGAKVARIEVSDLRDNTFYAIIHLYVDGNRELAIDARPSDAIALALRTDSPIFVAEEVINKSKEGNTADILKKLSSEDFGKYMM
jgi:bifunctional DNase/RNase